MTVIDQANLARHTPARKRLRWVTRQVTDLLIVGVPFVGLLVVINWIERLGS